MSDVASTVRGRGLRAHAFLAFLLCLVAANAFVLVWIGDFGYDRYLNLAISIGLLLIHIGARYVTTGWRGRAMRAVMFAWIGLVFVYIVTLPFPGT